MNIDTLRALVRQLADLPLLLLATYRGDELTRRLPLYQLLPTLERESRAARLDLRQLDAAALRALVGRYALAEDDSRDWPCGSSAERRATPSSPRSSCGRWMTGACCATRAASVREMRRIRDRAMPE